MQNLIKQLDKSNFFSTQITSPASSNGQKRSFFKSKEELFTKIMTKLKTTKKQVKSAQKQYSQILQKSHRKSVEYNQLIRFQFVKMYENKRYNLLNQQLKIKLINSKDEFQKSSTERVRHLKNQRDLHIKFLKNQQEDLKKQLQSRNKQDKMIIKKQLEESQQKIKEMIKKKSDKVKNSNNQFMIRKTNYLTMKGSKAKFNYMNKLKQQIQTIRGYQMLMNQSLYLEQFIPNQTKELIEKRDQNRNFQFLTHSTENKIGQNNACC